MTTSTTTIEKVMTAQPYTIGRDQTLTTAHRMMRSHQIRHLPVLEHGELVGVLTQPDLYFIEDLAGVDANQAHVDDAMSTDCYVVAPQATVREVAANMAERKLGSAVVVEAGRVIGIFTATDALRILGSSGR
jgi:acetoin utilization protein AcuB